MSDFRRQYLRSDERNFYMITKAFIMAIYGERNLECKKMGPVWEEWSKSGMITPKMQRNLKTAKTCLEKFCAELENNLSPEENQRLYKKLEKFDYRLVDDFTVQKLFRKANDKNVTVSRDCIIDIMEDIAAVRCVGCKEPYKDCNIHRMLFDMGVPYLGEEVNCPYAADLGKLTDKELKGVEDIKNKINSKNEVGEKY